jgi:uncharacterized protein YwgA
MESKGRLAKLESLVAENKGIESDRLQALVFIAQALGESYDYAFDVHHLRVFSRALESDLEFLSTQGVSDKFENSEISKFITKLVQSASTEQAEAAAAFFYFEQKGYSPTDIENALNADEGVMNGAKELISELRKAGSKKLAASGVN